MAVLRPAGRASLPKRVVSTQRSPSEEAWRTLGGDASSRDALSHQGIAAQTGVYTRAQGNAIAIVQLPHITTYT